MFKNKKNIIFNIGSSKKISILDLAKKIDNLFVIKMGVVKNDLNKKHNIYVPSARKILNLKNFNFINLDQSLIKTFKHLKTFKKIYL